MRKNLLGSVVLMAVIMLAAACSGEGQPAVSDTEPANDASMYESSVFLGDSITEGLTYYDVLQEEHVLAGAGKTAQFALENVDELVQRMPERVFIHLGSDDILWPTDDPTSYSLSYYAQLIDAIRDRLPDASVTILSVMPVTAEVEEKEPRYRNIDDYNEGLKRLAAEKQVGYADIASIAVEHPELYDRDGIHFQEAFYPIFLDRLKDELDQR